MHSDMDHTQFYLEITPCLPLLPSRRASTPFGWYSYYRPTESRRLSRPYITYCIVVGRQPNHDHRQNVQKMCCDVWTFGLWDTRQRQPHRQTDVRTLSSQYFAPVPETTYKSECDARNKMWVDVGVSASSGVTLTLLPMTIEMWR